MIEKIYIRTEYIDFVNPIVGEMNKVNYQQWDVIKKYEEWGLISDGTGKRYIVYDLKQDGIFLKGVREEYLIGINEFREHKIQQILE